MEKKHIDALNKTLPTLCKDMRPEETVIGLLHKGCFTEPMAEEARMITMTTFQKNYKIIELVKKTGPLAFDRLIQVFNESGQSDLVVAISKHLPDDAQMMTLLESLPTVPEEKKESVPAVPEAKKG